MKISEFRDGLHVFGQYLVADSKKGVTTNSKRYLTIVFQDATGTIEAKKWDYFPDDEDTFAKGNIVQIDGEVNLYREALQLKVFSGEKLGKENVDWSAFVPNAPIPTETLRAKADAYVNSINDPLIKSITEAMLKRFEDRYYSWPAACRNHHDYVSGLLYHSITMADVAAKVCEVYPALSRDMVLAGTIIHDMGKTIELTGPQATTFSLEGKLLGHISIGQAELRAVCKELGCYEIDDLPMEEQTVDNPLYAKKEIAVCLEHMILSHHTKPEFGSPVPPLTREALAVAMIDDLDAKMMILEKAYKGVAPGASTAKLFTMDDRYFYNPVYSKPSSRYSGTSLEEELADLAK